MNIGFEAKRLFKNKSGLGAYSRSLVRHLILFYPDLNIHLYTPPFVEREDTLFFINHERISVHILPYPSWVWRSFLLPIFAKKHHLDVFHGLSAELPLLKFSKKTKTILTIHDVIFMSHPKYYSMLDKWIYQIKLKHAIKKADQIIAISKFTKKQVAEYFITKKPITVISPIINRLFSHPSHHLKHSEFEALYNLRKGYFLYVGSLKGRKNTRILLKTLAIIPEEKKKKLVIITNDSAVEFLSDAVKYNVEDWVRVEKKVNDRTLSLYYSHCSALVYPSLVEGFGLPIVEGIFHSAIVVCSDHPALREAGGAVAEYFNPYNEEELACLLSKLSYYERKSKKATLSHLNTYNPVLICGELMKVYAQER
ncbi:MAG: glycosyltransferase family 1 protein [Saprospiraceae bacterium]